VETPPPTLGQHTEELLKQFGYSVEEMKSLKEKEII
jgi:crotonobetainyl-CoA:carnitine CoA-transferase CaiB-like acyl-CoA transferase